MRSACDAKKLIYYYLFLRQDATFWKEHNFHKLVKFPRLVNMSIEQLETSLKDLKCAIDNPSLYLANYFSDLRNRIDIDCIDHISQYTDGSETSFQFQECMISEVKEFEQRCLSNLNGTRSFDELVIKQVTEALSEASRDNVNIKEVSELVFDALSAVQRHFFLNRGILYLANEAAELRDKNVHPFQTFGAILIINDEFISQFVFDMNWLASIYA